MSVNPMDAKTAQMSVQQGDMQARARQIGNLTGPGGRAPVDKEKKLREACEGFESIFIQKMWEQMRATVPKNGMLHGKEEQFWQGMYDQELSKKMASAGGIGLADMMYDQLSRNLVSASRTTASAVGGREGGFSAQAAPLVPTAPAKAVATAPAKGGNSMYDGAAPHAQAAEHPEEPHAPTSSTEEQSQDESSPVVQQVLTELRQRQQANPEQGLQPTTVITTTVQGTGTTQTTRQSTVAAQTARQMAAARQPMQGGVLPPMQPMERQPRIDAFVPPPGQAQAVTQPGAGQSTQPVAQPVNGQLTPQGAQAPMPPQFIMNETPVAPAQPPVVQAAGAPQAAAVQRGAHTPQPAAAAQNAAASQEQPPEVITTTFTTNIPPKSRKTSQRRPPRVPSGQPLIRTLPSSPASPITPGHDPTQEAARMQQAQEAARMQHAQEQNGGSPAGTPWNGTSAPQG